MITIDYTDDFNQGKLFGFEAILKAIIDDGDSVWRKKRNTLLDPNMKSILMIVNRKINMMYILLFGEKI